MSNIANEFIQFARSNANQTVLPDNGGRFFFKAPFANGVYVYSIVYCADDPLSYLDPDHTPQLVCIKVGEKLYITQEFACGFRLEGELPESVYRFREVCAKMIRKVNEKILPQYLASLDVSAALKNEKTIKYAKEAAIKALLSEEPEAKPKPVNNNFLSQYDVAKILCGVESLEDLALTKLQEEKELWTAAEAIRRKTLEFMEAEDTIDGAQRKIAEAVRSANAVRLTVEFNFKGKTGTAKIDAEQLLRNLKQEDYFLIFNFATRKEGAALFECLHVNDYRGHGVEGRLTYRNISKIMYKGKVIFQV